MTNWIIAAAAVVQATFTVILVRFTQKYVAETSELAKATKEMAEATKAMADEQRRQQEFRRELETIVGAFVRYGPGTRKSGELAEETGIPLERLEERLPALAGPGGPLKVAAHTIDGKPLFSLRS
jgi:hypothetical protein